MEELEEEHYKLEKVLAMMLKEYFLQELKRKKMHLQHLCLFLLLLLRQHQHQH